MRLGRGLPPPRCRTCLADHEKAWRWAGPLVRSMRLELRDAADLLRVLVRLGLDGPSRLISRAQRYLSDALVGVDHLLQAVPYQLTLNRHKVLNRAGASNPAHCLDVLLPTVLDETEHFLRDLLGTLHQDAAGLGHRLEVLGR